jgi:hypothetical protein
MNAKNSEMKVINSKNADQNTKNKVKKDLYFSNYQIEQARNPISGYRIFYYIDKDKDKNIVGFITLKRMNERHLQKFLKNLYNLIEGKIVYELSIQIGQKFRGKKFASDFLGKILDQIINKEDAFIFLIDETVNGIGEKFYGSRKISEKFDVYIILNNKNGKYLIGRKTNDRMVPQYLKINNSDQNKSYLLNRTQTRPHGQVHLNRYFEQYPENRPPNSKLNK